MAMDPKNHVAVRARSTTAPVSTTHSSSVVAPSAARKVLDTAVRTPAGPAGTYKELEQWVHGGQPRSSHAVSKSQNCSCTSCCCC
jgi:hypothetical protein